jgi:hypothetical protein
VTTAAYLQDRASAAWPALELDTLGGWLLRGGCGITKRANSVLALGDPARRVGAAIAAAEQWYAARSLPPRFQTFPGSPRPTWTTGSPRPATSGATRRPS